MTEILQWAALIWVPFFAMVLSVFCVHREIAILCRYGFAAEMGERHIHKRVIPTAGGVGMIFPFLIALALYYLQCRMTGGGDFLRNNLRCVVPTLLLLGIGLYDDRYDMRAGIKLMGQLLAALITWLMGLRFNAFFGIPLPEWLSCIVTVFWILLFINAYNLIDGLDGLAAGLAVVGSLSMAGVLLLNKNKEAAVVALTLTGVCLGFLRYNFHPARVFMGDTGSMFLGHTLATLGLITSSNGASFFSMIIPIMACGVPLFDTTLAVWRRATFKILSKRSWREIMSADRSHLHHRILDAQHGGQTRTAVLLYTLALILSAVGIAATFMAHTLPMISVILILFTMMLVIRKFAVLEVWNSTQLMFKGLSMPRKSVLVNILHPALDLLVIAFSLGLSMVLFQKYSITVEEYCWQLVGSSLIMMVSMALFGAYRVYWVRAGAADYFKLFKVITLGYLLVLAEFAVVIAYGGRPWNLLQLLLAYLLTIVLILGERILLAFVQLLLPRYYIDSEFNFRTVKTLVIGAGAQFPAYLRYSTARYRTYSERIVGILDDAPALSGHQVYGYKVLGRKADLEKLYEKHHFSRIVVTVSRPLRKRCEYWKEFCAENNVELVYFTMAEASEPLEMLEKPQKDDIDGLAMMEPER